MRTNSSFVRATDIFYELKMIVYRNKQRARYPRFEVYTGARFCFHTLEEAERKITDLVTDNKYSSTIIYCFFIVEIPFGTESWSPYWIEYNAQRVRSYIADGAFFTETLVSALESNSKEGGLELFLGRQTALCRFAERDIVEVFRGDEVTLEVVASLPPTPEQVRLRNEHARKYWLEDYPKTSENVRIPGLDYSDDSYITLDSDKGYMESHSHMSVVSLFPPRMKIPKWAEDKLYRGYDKLSEE